MWGKCCSAQCILVLLKLAEVRQFDDVLVRILLLSALVSFLLAYFNTDQKEEGLSAYIEPLAAWRTRAACFVSGDFGGHQIDTK